MSKANSNVTVKGFSRVSIPCIQTCVIVQEPVVHKLNLGLGIAAMKVPLQDFYHVRITVCNFSDDDIVLKKRFVIADVIDIRCEYDICRVVNSLNVTNTDASVHMQLTNQQSNSLKGENKPKPDAPAGAPPLTFKSGEDTPEEWRRSFSDHLLGYFCPA